MKMKNVALDFNFMRERIEEIRLNVVHISNTYHRTNILTRALRPQPLLELRTKLTNDY